VLQQHATDYLQRLSQLMLATEVTDGDGRQLSLDDGAERAVQMIMEVGSTSHKVMLVGNGGSSSVVSHVQTDIIKCVGVKAMVFTEQSMLTAVSNDHGYETSFQRPVEWWAEQGDLLIAVSSSGKSENILRAVKTSVELGCLAITFSGFSSDNPLRTLGGVNFYVQDNGYGYVETAHAALTHFITDRAMALIGP